MVLKEALKILIFFLFFLNTTNVYSQYENTKINAIFSNATFIEFVNEIEKQANCFFYYDKTQTDSLKINATFNNNTLNEVLEYITKTTKLKFSKDEKNSIYVTKNTALEMQLPIRYFEPTVEIEDKSIPEYYTPTKQSSIKSALENRPIDIGSKTNVSKSKTAKITGYIKDEKNNEPIIGALVFADNTPTNGVSTDVNGFFTIILPKGKHEIAVKSIGMKNAKRQIILLSDGKLNIEMKEEVVSINEVVITDKRASNIERMQMGMEKMDMKSIKQVPTVFGESDIVRVVMALPGVQTAGESSTGLIVRGGSADQNLILFNESPIYNPSHLFGFFSSFNPDVVKDVELFKSSIPAEYGGRLSSVLKINGKDADMKKFQGNAGLGLLTAKLTLEIPIKKEKTSLLIGGRSTYTDFLLKQVPLKVFQNSSASFFDFNAQITHRINTKNTLRLSAYNSSDKFSFSLDTQFRYVNQSYVVRLNSILKNNFTSEFSSGLSRTNFEVVSNLNPINAYNLSSSILQSNTKVDFKLGLGHSHKLDFGAAVAYYAIKPGDFAPIGDASIAKNTSIEPEKALESAFYLADNYDITPRFSIYAGLRFSIYNYLGSKNVNKYKENMPLTEENMIGVDTYKSGQFIKTYAGLEPRIALKYSLTENTSLKASYNRNRQYISQLSNATAIAPTDIWKLSDYHIRPQIADQISIGLYKNLKQNMFEISTEIYYKNIIDAVDYIDGARLLLNKTIERDVINAHGKAYGAEFMIKKTQGKLNGWVSYTFSRSLVQINNPTQNNVVNNGEYFAGNFDKPHSLNFIGNYKITKRLSFSLNVVYSTGRPITLPNAQYKIDGIDRIFYSDRNQYRIPDYFRSDIAFNLDGNHSLKQKLHFSWTLSVYNVTGRQNVYSIFFKSDSNGELKGYQMSIFGIPIPTLTVNCRF